MRALTVLVLMGALLAAGCNTIEGVGKDVSSVGSTVAKTASDAKN